MLPEPLPEVLIPGNGLAQAVLQLCLRLPLQQPRSLADVQIAYVRLRAWCAVKAWLALLPVEVAADEPRQHKQRDRIAAAQVENLSALDLPLLQVFSRA